MRCDATRIDGQPCANWPMENDTKCGYHTAHRPTADARRAIASAGGFAKHYGAAATIPAAMLGDQTLDEVAGDLKTATGVRDMLAATMQGVARGTVDIRIARVMAQLALAQRMVVETSDLEQRLAAIEAAQDEKAA